MNTFDFKAPDYAAVYNERSARLRWLRDNPAELSLLKQHYLAHPDDFINDWGETFDPRNADIDQPTIIPFVLFQKQRDWINWFIYECWKQREHGLTEKSRDMGISWLATATASSLALLGKGYTFGFGSRKEMYVDQIGWPGSLFWKARFFISRLPPEFRGSWIETKHSSHMRITFPDTGSVISGEAGDNIGRGDRTTAYFTDEDAHIAHPEKVDAALSQTTNVRIRMSSVNGMNNPFAQLRHSGKVKVFTFGWRDDPRKDQAWYDKQVNVLDPIIVAQEIDIDYLASATGVIIPQEWARAAVGAAARLGIALSGPRRGAMDVADEGNDMNGYGSKHGIQLEMIEEWSGKGSDIYDSVVQAFAYASENGDEAFNYDADGLGAGVRGDARVINEKRAENGQPEIEVEPYRGSGEVFEPESPIPVVVDDPGAKRGHSLRLNGDYFGNAKAQGWFSLRVRFLRTFRAIQALERGEQPIIEDPDGYISLNPNIPLLNRLITELGQPQRKESDTGKLYVDKTPDGMKSPNLGDTVMILYAPRDNSHSIFG